MLKDITLKRIFKYVLILALYLSLPLFVFFTNPQNLPIPLLLMPIVLLFIIIYFTVYLFIMKKINRAKKITRTRLYVISGIITLIPVLIIVLASINQFTLRDIILSAVIIIISSWYLLKVDFLKN